jgi:predicted enzyme related to lactoylglutathione lyase
MSERNGYEPGVPCWVTALQPDCERGAHFYGELLGWQTDATDGFFTARHNGRDIAAIAPQPSGADPDMAAWITNVYTDDPDAVAERARQAGGQIVAEPFDLTGGRLAVIADPAGAVFGAWRGRGAGLVNEPGAWAMSQLHTPDPDGAAAFYGAVFGWTTEAFGPFTMFRLPGYVGGEPEQPVSREVVATMGRDDGPARWTPDFWVRDADGLAEKAQTLGGATVAGPYDTPMSRAAVLADPFGATFTITQMNLLG